MLIAYAVSPTINPMGKMSRSGHAALAGLRNITKGAIKTKINAGKMCARVRAACDAKSASRAASCGGAECGGLASANIRRRTTATAIAVHAQKAIRRTSGGRGCSGRRADGDVLHFSHRLSAPNLRYVRRSQNVRLVSIQDLAGAGFTPCFDLSSACQSLCVCSA